MRNPVGFIPSILRKGDRIMPATSQCREIKAESALHEICSRCDSAAATFGSANAGGAFSFFILNFKSAERRRAVQ